MLRLITGHILKLQVIVWQAAGPRETLSFLQGQWNITAGQNDLFDTFDCQKHYFKVDEPGVLYGDINWRVRKSDGDFLERSAVQTFKQVPILPICLMVRCPSMEQTYCFASCELSNIPQHVFCKGGGVSTSECPPYSFENCQSS